MYTGVMLKDVLAHCGLKPNAWWLPEGADASAATRSIPMEKALDDCMIAWKMNGEALRPEQGYPMRLVVPGWEGNGGIGAVPDRGRRHAGTTGKRPPEVPRTCWPTAKARRFLADGLPVGHHQPPARTAR